jgi:type I restriction enzyme S subunit
MPEHWQSTTLGEVADVVSDRVNPTATEDALYVGLEHLVTDQRRLLSWGSTADVSSSTTPFRPGDTLFGRLRPYLRKGCVVEVEGVCTPEILVVRSKGLVDEQFVGLLVLNDQVFEECVRLSAGSRMPRTSAKDLKALSVLIPSLPEQRRIVDLVGAIDAYIDALEAQIDTTRTARMGVLSDLLSNPGDDWQTTTLGESAEVNPKEPPLSEDALFVPMDAVNVGQRWVEYTEPRGKRSGARARGGDTLFARITPCLENGKTAQVQSDIDRCGGSTEFIVLRGNDRIHPDFIYFWATDQRVREQAASLMTGSTGRQRLSPKDLAAMSVELPPPEEQRRIVDLIGSIDGQITGLKSQVAAARDTRSGVLSELLSGERLLTDDYEVAVGL